MWGYLSDLGYEVIENTQKQREKYHNLKNGTMNELLTKGINHKEFKDSDLGRIPKNWSIVKLKDIAVLIKGVTYASRDYSDEHDGLPFLTLKSIAKNGGYSPNGLKFYRGDYKEHHVLKFGDIIFANTDLTRNGDVVGSPVFFDKIGLDKKTLFSMDLSKLTVNLEKVDSQFLYYLLMTHRVKRWMVNSSAGSTVLHLDTKRVKELILPLPPLSEQKRIASILNSIDEVAENTKKKVIKNQSLKKSLMQDLLTGKVRVTVN
jgi:type I restriction enzyme, S subunit